MLSSRTLAVAASTLAAALFATPPALAGTATLTGQHVEYVADSGEQNDVLIGFGSAFDPTTGLVVEGFVVRDSAGVTPGAGCRLPNPFDDDVAICDAFTVATASVDLRDGNDEARVDESAIEVGGSTRYFIDGDLGNDTIVGGSLSDLLIGNAGTDRLEGGAGNDRVEGGINNDTVLGGNGGDVLIGYLGDDTVEGGAAADFVDGGGGADKVRGDGGVDEIEGGPGPDEVRSLDGNPEQPHCGLGRDQIERDASDDPTSCEDPL